MSEVKNWGSYMVEIYTSRKPPPATGTVDFDKLEQKAREALKDHPGMSRPCHTPVPPNIAGKSISLSFFPKVRFFTSMGVPAPALRTVQTGKRLRLSDWFLGCYAKSTSAIFLCVGFSRLVYHHAPSDAFFLVCLQVTLFGVKYPVPLLIAPVGVQGLWHADGELAVARAARNLGVPFIFSTASTRSIEEVAKANGDSQRWYQLYW